MTVIEKLTEIKENIKIKLDAEGFDKYTYYVGRPEIYDDDINNNLNLFPIIIFTNNNFIMEQNYVTNFVGKINTTLIISDVDKNEPIFDYLDNNILKNILNVINENNDIIINNITYDDDIDCVYSIIVDLEISFDFSLI